MSAGYAFDWDAYWRDREQNEEWWATSATEEGDE
jgi:hypothetical protein